MEFYIFIKGDGQMKDMSYQELLNCQTYAEHVLNLYKKTNNGELLEVLQMLN